jgi:hypothetical protein
MIDGKTNSEKQMIQNIAQNVQFRVDSAVEMITSIGNPDRLSPVQRRVEILNMNMSALSGDSEEETSDETQNQSSRGSRQVDSSGSGYSRSQNTESDRSNNSSGRLSVGGNAEQNPTSESVSPSVLSMSDVNRGTKKRAQDRGY